MSKLDDLFAFLSIPSVSAVAEYAPEVERCADFLVTKLSSLGFDAVKHMTEIHPIVVACFAECREQHTRQNRDDCDDDKKFDEGETSDNVDSVMLFEVVFHILSFLLWG